MEENKSHPEHVPYIIYESAMARADSRFSEMENRNKSIVKMLIRAWIISSIILIGLCVYAFTLNHRNNERWIAAWESYDYSSETYTIESSDSGDAHYVGDYSAYVQGDGDITYGKDNGEEAIQETEKW